jgi:hypothetical protein
MSGRTIAVSMLKSLQHTGTPSLLRGAVLELELDNQNPQRHVYSRYTQDTSGRVEGILGAINIRGLSLLFCPVHTHVQPITRSRHHIHLGTGGRLCYQHTQTCAQPHLITLPRRCSFTSRNGLP